MKKWKRNEIVAALKDGCQIRLDNIYGGWRLVDKSDLTTVLAYLTVNQVIKLPLVEVKHTTLYTYYELMEA